jgi:hypothetical protein
MDSSNKSLEELHQELIVRLASALGNLRLLAIGAPFACELIRLAEHDVEAALTATRSAESVRYELSGLLGAGERGAV